MAILNVASFFKLLTLAEKAAPCYSEPWSPVPPIIVQRRDLIVLDLN